MPRRTRAEMIAGTRASLLASARAAFGAEGYADTSMDDLTAAAGLTRGALYHHFGGKDGLLEAVVAEIGREMLARYEEAFAAAPDTWSGLRACCRLYLTMALEPEIQRIVLRDAPAVLGQRFRAIDAEASLAPMAESLRELMAEGLIRRTDPEALARLLNGALVDAALWIAGSSDDEGALARALDAFDVLLEGLRREPRREAS